MRKWAIENEELYIVTGPVFKEILHTIGENEVAVPKYSYKIALDYQKPEIKAIGFVMENKSLPGSLFDYAVTIDSIEILTNIDFFSKIPDSMEEYIESSLNIASWKNASNFKDRNMTLE